jgi:hypothetical protein
MDRLIVDLKNYISMMNTSIEDLPVELWISIFSYFEAHELLQAFSNLNNHFNQLIASDYLLFNVRLGKSNQNPFDYSTQPYWSHSILNRIHSLQSIIQDKTSHIPEFLRWHCSQLIQLKFLKIKLRGREIPTVCIALPQLHSLQYLSIKCLPNQLLLETILSVPALLVCQLDFLRPITPINSDSNSISNVEILNIKLQDNSHGSIMNLLLSHMPRLKRLEMNNYDIYVKNYEWIFFQSLFILPELRTVKVKWSSNYSSPIVFQNLHQNLPAVKRFYLHMNFDFIDQDLLDNLIQHWWPIFEKIERINIFIKCQYYSIIIDPHIQIYLNAFQSHLLAMNEQYNRSVKFEYTEKVLLGSKIIEISISKFY